MKLSSFVSLHINIKEASNQHDVPKGNYQISMSKESFKICFCFRRMFRIMEPEPPEDVKALFKEYSENGTMTLDHLHRFLIEFQREKNATKDDAHSIFNSLKHLNVFQRKGLHLHAFFRYLLGDLNSPLPPSPQVVQDMGAPLAHYFMYTGHNSYLTGNQLSSSSSSEPISKALRVGVRVIELDLWPNSSRKKVEVRHGGTLTSSVDLSKCLNAIKSYAFSASKYPIVITFEDHLTPNLQAKVAKMVNRTLKPMLHLPKSDYTEEFPSPESLKNKIMISTKPPEYLERQMSIEEGKDFLQVQSDVEGLDGDIDEEDAFPEYRNEEGKDFLQVGSDAEGRGLEEDGDEENAFPEYRNLISIHAGKPKGGLTNCLKIDPNRVRRLSLSEQELEVISRRHGTEIVRFTQRNLLRVYPKGTRVDSSNYNPLLGWRHGAQMVAFNMQGYGKYLWIMQGMFQANGGCGYVKKPNFLLSKDETYDPEATLPVKTTLKVTVYLGEGWRLDFRRTHFDRFSPPDFFARVGIAGVPDDTVMKKTKAVEDEWTPVWNEEFEFELRVPELAILRVEVLEYDTTGYHDFGGQTCLPVWELREGIRAVPLYNRKGQRFASVKLLMRFEFLWH